MKPLVSILCPALNEESYLEACLASLLAQTYSNTEILVLYDEASTDRTLEIISSFLPRLQLISLPHMSISAALNEGLKRAKGEHIFYVEGDCLYAPETVELSVRALFDQKVGGVALLCTYYGVKGIWGEVQNEFQAVRDEWFLQGRRPLNWCYFYRRTVLDQFRGFNEQLLQGEDQFLAQQIKAAGYQIVCLPQKLRQHAMSDSINSPLKTASASLRAAYLHALQSFSPQLVGKRLFFLGLLVASLYVFFSHGLWLPLAAVLALAYLYNFTRILPFASMLSPAALMLVPFISMYKAFFYALGYLHGFLARPFAPISRESREHAGAVSRRLTVLMFGKSERGGFYYYTTLLTQALAASAPLAVHCTNDWRALFKADLVHYQYDDLFPLHRIRLFGFLCLARLLGKPVVVTAHNPVARGTKNPLKYLFYLVASRLIVHNPTHWAFASKSTVIPHGNYCFYLDFASPLSRTALRQKWLPPLAGDAGQVVLSYGTLRGSKNYGLALEVMAELRRRGTPALFVIAGNGSAAEARRCGLENLPNYVRFHRKYLSETETTELFTLADVVLLTNLEHDHSGIPHIAHCFHKPVLAPRCLAHQTRFTASTRDEYVELLAHLLTSKPDLQQEYLAETRDYSWEKVAEKTLALYHSLLRKR